MSLPCTPWFDSGTPDTRAWPPPSGLALGAAMRDVRARDRHGDAIHLAAAIAFAFLVPLGQAPASIGLALLFTIALIRGVVFPVLFTPLLRWPPLWLGLAWVAWSAASSMWSPVGGDSLKVLSPQRVLLAAVALFPMLDRVRLIAWALVCGVGCNAMVQVLQSFGWLHVDDRPTWRPAGFAGLPAVAAINAGIALLLGLSLIVGVRISARVALGVLISISAAGLVLTSSRHPTIALVFALPFLPLLLVIGGHVRLRAALKGAAMFLLVAVASLIAFGQDFLPYLEAAQRDVRAALRGEAGFSSIHARLFWWQLGIEEWLAHPIAGGGLSSFRGFVELHPSTFVFVAESGISLDEVLQKHPHSSYVRALAETGIVGFALLVGLVFACMRSGLLMLGRDPMIVGAVVSTMFVALATAGECIELMNVAYAPAVIAVTLAAAPRWDGCSLPTRRV
jgi:O-antigen ligase